MRTNSQYALTVTPSRRNRAARLASSTLVLVASPNAARADAVAERLRATGAVAYAAHSWQGALRVATAVGPDVVLLDPALPDRLRALLRAHPTSARATVLSLSNRASTAPSEALAPAREVPLHAAA